MLNDLGYPKIILGIEIIRLGNHTIGLKQSDLISRLLSTHGIEQAKAATCPMSQSADIPGETEILDETVAGQYKSIVGSLPYITLMKKNRISRQLQEF